MEADVTTVVRGDTACISALHVLKVYAQRLGCDLRSGRLVSRVMASSFLLVSRLTTPMCGSPRHHGTAFHGLLDPLHVSVVGRMLGR